MGQTLNENIKALRIQSGFNQVEFAKIMGVSKQCISNWENDNIQPSIEMLTRLADFFRVSTDYLLGRENREQLDASGLTPEQKAHIRMIITDFSQANNALKQPCND